MKAHFIFYLILKHLICDCHWKCSTCTEYSDTDGDHKCITCRENTYNLILSNNCYFSFEVPRCFLTPDYIFDYCSSACYECTDYANKCLSCNRGYALNEIDNTCTVCDSNYYKYVSDGIEQCQGGVNSMYICELKKTICTDIDINEDNFECPREYPLLVNGQKECSLEIYNSINHTISNQIIKTQWLNKRIQIGGGQCWYITSEYSSQGDLIFETNRYEEYNIHTTRYFYGIKSNGRLLFYDDTNNEFVEQKTIEAITVKQKFESQLIKINLENDDDNKDYFLSCSFTECSIEINDFYNNRIVGISQYIFFGEYFWSTKIFNILPLKNENKSYLFCFIALSYPTHYIMLQKFKFYKPDLSEADSYERIKVAQITEEFSATQSKIISCIEISTYNMVQCFYINIDKYFVLSLFNENSLELIKTTIVDEYPIVGHVDGSDWDYFFKSIYLKNEISILAYILDPNTNSIYIKTKIINYENGEYLLEDYLLSHPKIEVNLNHYYEFSSILYSMDLVKINEVKFCLIATGKSLYDLYIILFDFYNYQDSNLFIRYYHIPLRFYDHRVFQYILGVNFNGFLGLVYTIQKLTWDEANHYFSMLSYIRSIDSNLITLNSDTTITLSDYINQENIENNVFGVNFYGVIVLKLPKNIGIYYFSQKKNNLISENDILDPDDVIIFVYDYEEITSGGPYIIEFAGVVQEPLYQEFNKYPEYTEYYGSYTQEAFYNQRVLNGRTAFYNFTIPSSLTGVNDGTCKSNCKVCFNIICVKCLNNYIVKEDPNSCIANAAIEGYYLDEKSYTYKKCHESCKTCSKGPTLYEQRLDVEDSNCDICKDDYYKVINTNNCLYKDDTPIAHYLDLRKELFVNCYENCMTCEKSKTNSTYFNCLSCDDNKIYYDQSTNCLNCSLRGKYVNYYQYKCIDEIPNGYYLFDEELGIINKCYKTCKHCDEQGTSEDHKCTECAEAYPYNYNNGEKCLDDCSKENLYFEDEKYMCYRDCSDNTLNDKIYNYKKKCISNQEVPKNYMLDDSNNFVSKCDPKKDYEFNNECYSSCPSGTKLDKSITTKNMCICNNLYYLSGEDYICISDNVCPTDYPYLKLGTSECHNCPVIYRGECLLECPENTCITQINENLATCIEKLSETKILGGLCFDDFLRILDGIDNVASGNIVMNENLGVSINIYKNDVNLKTVVKSSNNGNLTFIDLGECKEKLIEYHNLNPDQKFCIISVDMYTKWSNKSTNDFIYEIYLENGTQIEDLSPCYEYPITISAPIINTGLVNYNEAKIFEEQGYNIYDLSSEFYTDKCTAAYINGNDIIIKDRLEDIYPHNVSFCPNGCGLNVAEVADKRFNCSCNISFATEQFPPENNEENLNIQGDESFLAYLLDFINYKLFGCAKIIYNSSPSDAISNVAFYLGTFIVIFNIASFWIFFLVFLTQIRIQIFNLIPDNIKLFNKAQEFKKKLDSAKNLINKNTSNPIRKGMSDSSLNTMNSNKELKSISKGKKKNKKVKKSKFESKKFDSKNSNKNGNKEKYKAKKSMESYKLINVDDIYKDKIILNDDEIEPSEYNEIPYTQALRVDKRNFFSIYYSLIKMKINIITIIFYHEDFTHRSLLLSMYFLDFLFNYFMNALFYSDDVVSQKYHNNGNLDLVTSLSLSLASKIFSSIAVWIIKNLTDYHEFLQFMIKDLQNEKAFIRVFKRVYIILKVKISLFFILSILISLGITYYLYIFCIIYKKSQISLLTNFSLGEVESLLKTFIVVTIVCILRFISLKFKIKSFYRTSIYLNDVF